MWRTDFGARLNSAIPPALSVIGPKVSIARMYAVVMSMPMVATAVPKMPNFATSSPTKPAAIAACSPNQCDAKIAMEIETAVTSVVSKPTAVPEMMFVAAPVRLASASSRTGRYEPAV